MRLLFRIFFLPFLLWPITPDLLGAEKQTVIIDRGAWGRLARLPAKDWLAVLTRFSQREPSRLSLYRSTNHCRSWDLLYEIREPGRKLDNGELLTLSNRVVWLTCRSVIDEQSYQLPVYCSKDQGRTWTRIGSVDNSEGPPGALRHKGLWEPFLFMLPDGTISAIYSSEKHPGYSQVLSQKVSYDGGNTWGPEKRIVEQPNGGNLRPGMGVVARLSDGRFILVYEIVGIGRGQVHFKLSPDGITWPTGLGTPIPGHEAAPYVTVLANGNILLTSCSNILSTSNDAGTTWHTAKSPLPGGFKYTWPALYEIAPDQVAVSLSSGSVRLLSFQLEAARQP